MPPPHTLRQGSATEGPGDDQVGAETASFAEKVFSARGAS